MDKNIDDILTMTIDNAYDFFLSNNQNKIASKLKNNCKGDSLTFRNTTILDSGCLSFIVDNEPTSDIKKSKFFPVSDQIHFLITFVSFLFFFKILCHCGLGSDKIPFQKRFFSSIKEFDNSKPSVAPNSRNVFSN